MNVLFTGRATVAALLISTSTIALAQDGPADEIIVTGSPLERSIDEAITGVSVLTGDELSDRLAATIGETLKSEPGVSSTFFGAGASRPIIRGQGGDRVRVLNNGIGSIDASSASPDHAVAAEPAQAERIEVLRGASLLRYGSSGSGGVVNVIDGRIPDQMPDGIDGSFRIGGSTVDNGFEAAGSVDVPLGETIALHLDGTFKEAQDYDIPGFAKSEALRAQPGEEAGASDTLPNSAAEASSLTGGLSYIGERGHLGVAVHDYQSDYGVPGDDEEAVTISLDQTRIDLNGAIELDGFIEQLQIFGGYADYEHTEFEAPGEAGTVFTNEGFEIRGEAIQREHNGWAAAYGLQIRERDFAAIGEEAFVPPTTTQQFGVYTFHEKEIGNVHLEGAARFETTQQEDSVTGDDRRFNGISLSAGGDIHVSETVRLGGTVFRTERAPTTEELFSNGPHLATGQFEQGDSDLGLETATGIEAALRHRAAGHFLTVNLFYTDYSDYIFEAETGAIEDDLPVFQFTGADAQFSGFEIQGGVDIGSYSGFDVKLDALAEFVRAKTDDDDLPRIPPLSILAGIDAKRDDLSFRAEVDYTARQNKLAFGETPTEDFTRINIFASWTVQAFDNPVKISASALNLFDSEGRQHTSFLKDVVPLPGRNFRLSLSSKF